METGLPAALRQDKKYQKAQKSCNKANEKMQDLNLPPQQWDTIDAAITAENNASIEYIRIAHKQGIIDAFSILREQLFQEGLSLGQCLHRIVPCPFKTRVD